jgi:hypothetical protein
MQMKHDTLFQRHGVKQDRWQTPKIKILDHLKYSFEWMIEA